MIFEKNETILFTGDSVTDCNRNRSDLYDCGEGYVNLIRHYLVAKYPELQLKVQNLGISGARIIELADCIENNDLNDSPDWLCMMIGINDVWRHFDRNFTNETLIDSAFFFKAYDEIINKASKRVKGIIILSPFMIEANQNDAMRQMVDQYRAISEKLSQKHHLIYVDCQKAFDQFLKYQSSYILSPDRVHPNLAGHVLIADSWLDAVVN
ncbi:MULTISPECIES: SGNH/GDSL hydrolase family protein [unclassified Enterococcus]|uniref:SGNH/GDSL hydrolase family protein n=1 Tax=unclassified Enterococcus TaxID=2608891 RepID=UPI0015516A90|nr:MULTISPECIES: SGNH/GDSL hydrolase family protein [unclassified Enterococcus]MBS7578159.1 SGNH/GDSL hydrolase family protein [Enterococcus sp. MMGLQ5-2]MBS7584025.1 SGNH/GDSL hydrolase family protein [Enterococcus sp. MMGLQ5-1]NPD11886.1 SGNH/GDSL hydrolase family protein [Enterococcus sp. MMGLQ5-1]NPD37990.1 SGNH/GDSL hydrolase family protein [Enterococcus sp. MMGLQ5-2]